MLNSAVQEIFPTDKYEIFMLSYIWQKKKKKKQLLVHWIISISYSAELSMKKSFITSRSGLKWTKVQTQSYQINLKYSDTLNLTIVILNNWTSSFYYLS